MKLPAIVGIIRRRVLVNFQVDAGVIGKLLPPPFRPKLHRGFAIAGICLIRLEQVRPRWLPGWLGISSENAAHRIAVLWNEPSGQLREGVFIPRRDTNSRFTWLGGGRIFPGEQNLADFKVADDGCRLSVEIRSRDGRISIQLNGMETAALPTASCFSSLEESSSFFESGNVGYSPKHGCCRLDGIRLETHDWSVRPFAVEQIQSSFFADKSIFPAGSVTFDHALIMRDLPHDWHTVAEMSTERSARQSVRSTSTSLEPVADSA